jgi:Pentapeptide repeats (8 copies)
VKSNNTSRTSTKRNCNQFSGDYSDKYMPGTNKFQRGTLKAVNFRRCILANADFSEAKFTAVNFNGANLADADFTDARFTNVDFNGAKLTGAIFANAKFTDANFEGADLSEANFEAIHVQVNAYKIIQQYLVIAPLSLIAGLLQAFSGWFSALYFPEFWNIEYPQFKNQWIADSSIQISYILFSLGAAFIISHGGFSSKSMKKVFIAAIFFWPRASCMLWNYSQGRGSLKSRNSSCSRISFVIWSHLRDGSYRY